MFTSFIKCNTQYYCQYSKKLPIIDNIQIIVNNIYYGKHWLNLCQLSAKLIPNLQGYQHAASFKDFMATPRLNTIIIIKISGKAGR